MSKSYFVLSESLDQIIKDFKHLYGTFDSQDKAKNYIEEKKTTLGLSKVKIMKITFEELP